LQDDDLDVEGNLASLLFRYTDASVLRDVLVRLDQLVGRWACVIQDNALAYVLKVDPATAEPLIERAVEARGPNCNACRRGVLTGIGALETSW
jgi:hypothetical protein